MSSRISCKLHALLDLIGDHTTLAIIHDLSAGPKRSLELVEYLTGVSTKTISDRLKRLQRDGVVERISYPESPPRVVYSLTRKGLETIPILRAIAEIASRWGTSEAVDDDHRCEACTQPDHARTEGLSETPRSSHLEERRPPGERVSKKKELDVTLL